MTRNGSSVLVMGFTGAKALNFKIGLMNRFDQMEQFILSLSKAKREHLAFTQAIMGAHEEPKHYHFSNEADMINRIVLGMSARQFREANGIAKGKSIRPYLNAEQIQAIEMLQRVDIGLLVATPEYEDRKRILGQSTKGVKNGMNIIGGVWLSLTRDERLIVLDFARKERQKRWKRKSS